MITHAAVAALLASEYVTVREAADMLGRHVNTIYRWAAAGRIESVHIGSRAYITTGSLLLLLGLDPLTGDIKNPGQLRLIMGEHTK